jgi:hypothetical protein
LIAVFLVYLSFPPQINRVHGIALPEKVVRPANTSSAVSLFGESPLTAQQLGTIHLVLRIGDELTSADEEAVANKARELAANLGANGIVTQMDAAVGSGPFRALMYRAQAIYVPKGGV